MASKHLDGRVEPDEKTPKSFPMLLETEKQLQPRDDVLTLVEKLTRTVRDEKVFLQDMDAADQKVMEQAAKYTPKHSLISPLIHSAALWNCPTAIKRLVELRADPEMPDAYNCTPFITAVENGSLEAAKTLLALGADVNHADVGGMTALMRAVWKGRLELISFLMLEASAATGRVNAAGKTFRDYVASPSVAAAVKECVAELEKRRAATAAAVGTSLPRAFNADLVTVMANYAV